MQNKNDMPRELGDLSNEQTQDYAGLMEEYRFIEQTEGPEAAAKFKENYIDNPEKANPESHIDSAAKEIIERLESGENFGTEQEQGRDDEQER